jgi:aspartate dehydrogenase
MAGGLTVAIGGLGAIGTHLARALDAGVEGLSLVAVAARDRTKAERTVSGFRAKPAVVALHELAERAEVVVEAAPAAVFAEIAEPAVARGRVFVPASVGALLPRMHLVERARETGARIVVPTGALLGLDAVRAAAEGEVESVAIETRKPPRGLVGAPYLEENGIDVLRVTQATRVFAGNAFDAARGFPANVNVAAALALAGVGPERTRVEIWADPAVSRNTHTIRVEAAAARLTMTIENVPSEANPRTGLITPLSILVCLRGLTSTLKVGS